MARGIAAAPPLVPLCLVAPVYLLYLLWLGAFLPTLTGTFVLPGIFLFAAIASLADSIWLVLYRDSRGAGLRRLASTVVVVGLLVTLARPIRTLAARQTGERAQRWAENLLERPRREIVDPTDKEDPRLKSELIPGFLKRGHFRAARLEQRDAFSNEPFIQVVYGGHGGVAGYYLGKKSLDIRHGTEPIRRIVPGVFSFESSVD